MPPRLKRIERWLGRLMAACGNEQWTSAIAEAECLEAEVKVVREELYTRLAECETPHASSPRGKRFSRRLCLVACLLSLFFVGVLPLSIDREAYRVESFVQGGNSFEWVTGGEREFLRALRETLSRNNEGRAELPVFKAAEPSPHKPALVLRPVAKKELPLAEAAQERAAPPTNAAGASSMEDVWVLIQVGQKTLRAGEPAIKIEKNEKKLP